MGFRVVARKRPFISSSRLQALLSMLGKANAARAESVVILSCAAPCHAVPFCAVLCCSNQYAMEWEVRCRQGMDELLSDFMPVDKASKPALR